MRIHLWNVNISYFIYWRSILRIKLRWIWHLRNTLNNGVDVLKLVLVILILNLKVKIWRLMLIIINWAFLIILVVRINLILILVFYHILRWELHLRLMWVYFSWLSLIYLMLLMVLIISSAIIILSIVMLWPIILSLLISNCSLTLKRSWAWLFNNLRRGVKILVYRM